MSTLEAKNVVKIYEETPVPAVKGINFQVNDGEFIAILGPSGCGKSSTLRMIAGLEEITSGEFLLDGKVVNDKSPAERNVALAFESYALYSPMNVYENIAFPLRAAKRPKDEIRRRVCETIELFELQDIAKKKPSTLSGGQQQRVSLARALVRTPNIFLLDEPLSHMDQRTRADIRARIKHLHRQNQITSIYVTHDQEEAVSLADRVLLMSMGEIQQFGSVDELWNRPANIFVAGFIGEPAINFSNGLRSGANSIATMGVTWPCETELSGVPANAEIIVGFRPNKTSVSAEQTENSVPMTVSVVEFMGTEKQLTATFGGDLFRIIVPESQVAKPGDTVYVTVNPKDVLVFDKATEKAIYSSGN